MKAFFYANRTTILSIAVIMAIFCAAVIFALMFNEISPAGTLHLV